MNRMMEAKDKERQKVEVNLKWKRVVHEGDVI